MATNKEFVAYVAEQAGLGSALTFKKMFGEYGVYLNEKIVAFACDNSLFVKAAEGTADLTAALPQRPPYPGAKPYPVADELLDDPDSLKTLLERTFVALPAPKIKKLTPAAKKHGT